MAITFRHDAAAVTPPSNSSTRKYGQELVMQQRQQNQQQLLQAQQQKYQSYQAGMDRLFDATKQVNQNQLQLRRDQEQKDFLLGRDKAQFEQQRQLMEAERQQKFMDEARKQSSGMIMEDIQNGEFDPATARKLQQNLVEESEALGNPTLDATQRAEALEKIRAARAALTANRMQRPPKPTAQDQFNQSIVTDPNTGMRYRQTAKGDYEPLEEPKSQRPKSFQEYYSENEDKFQKDLDSTMQSMQDNAAEGTTITPEKALEKMQKDYEFRQKALGKVGEPTAAPALPGAAPAAPTPSPSRSILEGEPTPAPVLRGAPPAPAVPTPSMSILERTEPTPAPELPSGESPKKSFFQWSILEQPPANPWKEVARVPAPATSQPLPLAPEAQPTTQPVAPPDFAKLSEGASQSDRDELQHMQDVYKVLPLEGQQAINVILSDSASREQKAAANRSLLKMGINLQDELTKRQGAKDALPGWAASNAVM